MNHTETKEPVNREDCRVLASISDQEFYTNLATLGEYRVPACHPGQPFTMLAVYGRRELYDVGDDRKGERYWEAGDIARSILAEHNPDADLRRFGVFLCATGRPTAEELAAARARRDAFDLEQVQHADATYARSPNRPELITDVQRRAARALGLERPWLVKVSPMQECPACGEPVRAGVALCKYCGAILDEEKATRFGVLRGGAAANVAAAHAASEEPVGAASAGGRSRRKPA
jgi:ribosomal protein L32